MNWAKFTDEQKQQFCSMVERGQQPDTVAGSMKIPPDEYAAWMKRGEEAKSGAYRDFYLAVHYASKTSQARLEARMYVNALESGTVADQHRILGVIDPKNFNTKVIESKLIEHPTTAKVEVQAQSGGEASDVLTALLHRSRREPTPEKPADLKREFELDNPPDVYDEDNGEPE